MLLKACSCSQRYELHDKADRRVRDANITYRSSCLDDICMVNEFERDMFRAEVGKKLKGVGLVIKLD